MTRPVGIRKIRTVFDQRPKEGSQTKRIKIPQPKDVSFSVRSRDVIRREYLRASREGFVVHTRGAHRDFVGQDYREVRAISKEQLRGTLPERIVYLWLIQKLHMKEGADFTFQSSLDGGRMTMGGIVADFEFIILKFILNVQGPTHTEFLRMRKDEEQRAILEDMGYRVEELTDLEIYNEEIFENKMRRMFNLAGGSGGGYSQEHVIDTDPGNDPILIGDILNDVIYLNNQVEAIFG